MIVQFFRYGNGLSKGPLDYLLGKDRNREHARILSGSESEISGLIDSSPYAKKYTSGCLSFYEEDLSPEAKKQIMADFEKCLFPGLSQDQYRVLWIEHQDKNNPETGQKRLELNFLIPNTEILTGDRLQPFFHKADMARVDLFKQITNFNYELHDPDDPLFRQAITSKKSLPKSTAEIKAVLDIEVQKAIETGLIVDRESMKRWLSDLGLEVSRETKKSLSIKNPSDDEKARPIRLTGAIYEQDFRVTATSQELTRQASDKYRQEARRRNADSTERYKRFCESKSAFFIERYAAAGTTGAAELRTGFGEQERGHTGANSPTRGGDGRQDAGSAAEHRDAPNSDFEQLADIKPLERNDRSRTSIDRKTDQNQDLFDESEHCNGGNTSRFSDVDLTVHEYEERTNFGAPNTAKTITSGASKAVSRQTILLEIRQGNYEHSERLVNHYRRATNSIDEATESTRRSIATYSSSEQNYSRAGDIQQQVSREAKFGRAREQGADTHHQETTEPRYIERFINELGDQLKTAITSTFKSISDRFKPKQSGEQYSAGRDQQAAEAANRSSSQENDFSRAISTKISGINPTGLSQALEKIEKRRKNDYDSPNPF